MRKNLIRLFYGLLYATPVFLLTLTACGGGGGGGSTPSFFSISGQTVNLKSNGLILFNSGVNNTSEVLSVPGALDGKAYFNFISSVAAGESYNITVKTNPSSPSPQRCAVTAGASSVAMTSDVTDVVVTCDYRTIDGQIHNLYGNTLFGLSFRSNLDEMFTISVSGVDPIPYSFAKKYADGDTYEIEVRAISGVCDALTVPMEINSSSNVIASGTIGRDVTIPEITCNQ